MSFGLPYICPDNTSLCYLDFYIPMLSSCAGTPQTRRRRWTPRMTWEHLYGVLWSLEFASPARMQPRNLFDQKMVLLSTPCLMHNTIAPNPQIYYPSITRIHACIIMHTCMRMYVYLFVHVHTNIKSSLSAGFCLDKQLFLACLRSAFLLLAFVLRLPSI